MSIDKFAFEEYFTISDLQESLSSEISYLNSLLNLAPRSLSSGERTIPLMRNRKYHHNTVSLKEQKQFELPFRLLVQNVLNIYEHHCKMTGNEHSKCVGVIKTFSRLHEYALFAFWDNVLGEKLDLKIYYRFLQACRPFIIQRSTRIRIASTHLLQSQTTLTL